MLAIGGNPAGVMLWDSQTGGQVIPLTYGYATWSAGASSHFEETVYVEGTTATDDCWIEVLYYDANGDSHPASPCTRVRVDFDVYDVDLYKESAGNSPDLDAGQICINAQSQYNRAKYKAFVWPFGTTASVGVAAGSSVTDLTFDGIDGADTSALEYGDEFWVIGDEQVGDYEITLTHNACSDAKDTDGDTVFKFEVQQGSLSGLDISVAVHGTYPYYDYAPGTGSDSASDSRTRDFWVNATGDTYSGKVTLTATYKAFGGLEAQSKKNWLDGISVTGFSLPIPGYPTARFSVPDVTGGVRAAAGLAFKVPHDTGCHEVTRMVYTNPLDWPLLSTDHQGGYPYGPTESGPLDITFNSTGSGAAHSLTITAYVDVSVNYGNINKGQARVSSLGSEINNSVFTIVP
jgi:hypothetical protein